MSKLKDVCAKLVLVGEERVAQEELKRSGRQSVRQSGGHRRGQDEGEGSELGLAVRLRGSHLGLQGQVALLQALLGGLVLLHS